MRGRGGPLCGMNLLSTALVLGLLVVAVHSSNANESGVVHQLQQATTGDVVDYVLSLRPASSQRFRCSTHRTFVNNVRSTIANALVPRVKAGDIAVLKRNCKASGAVYTVNFTLGFKTELSGANRNKVLSASTIRSRLTPVRGQLVSASLAGDSNKPTPSPAPTPSPSLSPRPPSPSPSPPTSRPPSPSPSPSPRPPSPAPPPACLKNPDCPREQCCGPTSVHNYVVTTRYSLGGGQGPLFTNLFKPLAQYAAQSEAAGALALQLSFFTGDSNQAMIYERFTSKQYRDSAHLPSLAYRDFDATLKTNTGVQVREQVASAYVESDIGFLHTSPVASGALVEVVTGRTNNGQGKQLGEMFRALATYAEANQPGTLAYQILFAPDDPDRFVIFRRYKDGQAKDVLEGSAEAAAFGARLGAIGWSEWPAGRLYVEAVDAGYMVPQSPQGTPAPVLAAEGPSGCLLDPDCPKERCCGPQSQGALVSLGRGFVGQGQASLFATVMKPLADYCLANEQQTLAFKVGLGFEDTTRVYVYSRFQSKSFLDTVHSSSALFKAVPPALASAGITNILTYTNYYESELGFRRDTNPPTKNAFVRLVFAKVQPGQGKQIAEIFRRLAAKVQAEEPDALTYQMLFAEGDPDKWLVIRRFKTKDALYRHVESSAAFWAWEGRLQPRMSWVEWPDVREYSECDVGYMVR